MENNTPHLRWEGHVRSSSFKWEDLIFLSNLESIPSFCQDLVQTVNLPSDLSKSLLQFLTRLLLAQLENLDIFCFHEARSADGFVQIVGQVMFSNFLYYFQQICLSYVSTWKNTKKGVFLCERTPKSTKLIRRYSNQCKQYVC